MELLIPISAKQREKLYQWRDAFIDIGWERNIKNIILTDYVILEFPVIEGTPYTNELFTIEQSWAEYLYTYSSDRNTFDRKCQFIIDNMPTKDMFKDHSLFLLKESLKIFSPYSNKAKELLTKLESLSD